MVKCSKGQVRWLKTALAWKGNIQRRQRFQMVLLRESGMTQPAIAAAMGVSLNEVRPSRHSRSQQVCGHNPGIPLEFPPARSRREAFFGEYWRRERV